MSNERHHYSGVVTALRKYHAFKGWPHLRDSADAIDRLMAALDAATKALIAERDVAYDSYTNAEGEYDDPECAQEVAELDAIIDACRIALGQQQAQPPSGRP